ncbi:MAG: nickel-binding protein [Pseudomonadota bacterium]
MAAKSNAVVAGRGEPYVWEHTYVAGDKLFCVHDAASPDLIRRHAAEGGFPVDSIIEISSTIGPATANV